LHAIIHRGLTPQSLSHVWLVLTLALTLTLAVGQSAMAHVATAGGPSVAPMVIQLASAPAATPLGQGPIGHHDAGGCRATADVEEREAAGDPRPLGPWTCPSHRAPATAPAAPPLALFAPDPRAGADALVAIYGGAGPHGPPAGDVTQSILADPLLPLSSVADGQTPAAPLFPTGPSPAITTVA
jgi:hypothetical protein